MEKQTIQIDNKLRSYLIGSMENPALKDGGRGWRQELTPELEKRGIYVFDPTRSEQDRIGMPTEEMIDKLRGWQLSGNYKLFIENMRLIWRGRTEARPIEGKIEPDVIRILGDIDFVENSDFIIWNHKEGDKPGGTIAELVIAWYRGIPVYLVTTMPKSEFNKSLLYFLLDSGKGQGRVFQNFTLLLEFLDDKYNLKKDKQC